MPQIQNSCLEKIGLIFVKKGEIYKINLSFIHQFDSSQVLYVAGCCSNLVVKNINSNGISIEYTCVEQVNEEYFFKNINIVFKTFIDDKLVPLKIKNSRNLEIINFSQCNYEIFSIGFNLKS